MVNNPLSHPWQTQVTKQFAAPRSEHVWSFQLQLHLANMNYNRNGSRQNGSRSTENDVDSAEATGLTRNLLVKQHGPWLSCFQYYSSMESRFLATDSPSLQYERENVNSFGFEPDAGFKEVVPLLVFALKLPPQLVWPVILIIKLCCSVTSNSASYTGDWYYWRCY